MAVEIVASVPEVALAFMIVFVPFFLMMGIKGFSDWIVSFIKIRQGYFSVNWIMKNHQWREKMIKPKQDELSVEGHTTPFINNPKFTAFRGSKKLVFFSRIGDKLKQLQIIADNDKDIERGIPPSDLYEDMLLEAEQIGRIFALKKSTLEKFLLYIAVGAAVGALLFGFINMGMLNAYDAKFNDTQTSIRAIKDYLTPQPVTAIPKNATVLTGG